jgi:uncharacterized protein (TIGR03435 family)
MARVILATALGAVLTVLPTGSRLDAAAARQNPSAPLEFEVASIKVHAPDNSGRFSSSMRTMPNGQIVMTNVSLRTLIGRAYPSRGSQQIINVPAWSDGVFYDVNVKANRPVSRDEQQAMWQALLADRLKLAAHYESREEATFDLVFARADHKLGSKMKPTTCPAPAPPPAAGSGPVAAPPARTPRTGADVMASCNGILTTGTAIFAPRTTAASLAIWLRSPAGRQVIDKTGLDGFFDVEFSYSTPRPAGADTGAADPGEPPEFFTALQDQLGFKLEPSRTKVEVLVLDHIDPPSEN